MKRLGLALLLIACYMVPAYSEGLYAIIAEGGAEGAVPGIRRELESRFDFYNRFFRFDPSLLPAPLNVRVFGDKDAYDEYIEERLGETRPGAAYLHYKQIERRELAINASEEASIVYEFPMLAHQSFIQYFWAFIPNPPSWMLEGFAIYFSENLLWLEAAKDMGDRLPSPEAIMLADASGDPPEFLPGLSREEFQISSWALVSFLLSGSVGTSGDTGGYYFRTLNDCFMLLSASANMADSDSAGNTPAGNARAENARIVMRQFSLWNDLAAMDRDFRSYIDSRQTYQKLMEDGHRAYSLGDPLNAGLSFLAAMDQYPWNFAPYYYLGLLSYEEKNYPLAEQYYLVGLERGGGEALINYALGLNAIADGRSEDAAGFLIMAAALDPARYQERVLDLLRGE